jgi:glycosyltransferase involved in cell wall biosynthesis
MEEACKRLLACSQQAGCNFGTREGRINRRRISIGIDKHEFQELPRPGTFREKVGIPEDERYIIFLGRLIPRKGADLLIDALSQISLEKLKLVIAGPETEASYLALLRRKALALGVANRVLFTGPLYANDKKAALVDAAVFVLPSRYENFGNTAAEAIACGTPVIVSDRCGIAPLVDKRAGLVTSYDSMAVAKTLQKLLENAELHHELKARCPDIAAEISWDTLIQQLQLSYLEAVGHVPY